MSDGWLPLSNLIAVLEDEQPTRDLRQYFSTHPGKFYTGSQFEALGGGPRALSRDVVTAEDLIAVQMLSVRVPGRVALDLLHGDLGLRISDELREIPIGLNLSDAEARPYVDDGGPADRAWRLLVSRNGVNKTIAGKLLARKRPRLIPVYDNVVACALRGRRGFWLWLHEQLQAERRLLTRRLGDLRSEACVPALVSDIRILDVVLWMRHVGEHRRKGCSGLTIAQAK